MSLGSDDPQPFFDDALAIGAFHAMKRGVLSSASAGNSGPSPATASNLAPWMLTVAASSMDRKFISQVVLGNGEIYPVSCSISRNEYGAVAVGIRSLFFSSESIR
ncbi:unnamed protein product [Linum tenue]|uniref:Peptidase S8/S53 domain-containing protein n=1 Tax=Linum tenue TaxID=586396 RepID=A0AAV0LRP1_9ROSI|nr:unnamed protein product [Linum tenue]